jgi:hypothetical protein
MAGARVKQLPTTNSNIVNKLVGNQKDRGKTELAALRESLKAQSRRVSGKKAQAVMEQIRTQYGNAELQKAVREFNLTFTGIQRDPVATNTKTLPASGQRGR